jgi:hypothetical protein
MLNNTNEFDADLSRGKWGENALVDILRLNGDLIEVKTDYKWQDTGNIFVETECWYRNDGKIKESGLNVSTAQWYAFVLRVRNNAPVIKIIPTTLLRIVVDKKGIPMDANQYGENPSKGYLITLKDIEDVMRAPKLRKPNDAIVADNLEDFMEQIRNTERE